jgi:hypothetical protein
MTLQYKVSRELGIVTVYPANIGIHSADREAFAVDLDETDLIVMLSALRPSNAPPAEVAGS